MPEPSASLACGQHRLRSEGKLIIIEFIGRLELDEFEQMVAFVQRVVAEQGHAYLLAQVRQAGSIAAPVRQQLGPWLRRLPLRGIANVEASVASRGLATLLANGLRLLYGINHPVGFHKDEAEARGWVEDLERKHAALR